MSKSLSKLRPSTRASVAPIYMEDENAVTELQRQRPPDRHEEPWFVKMDSMPV